MATIANFNIDQGSTFSTTIDVSNNSSGVFELNTYTARGKIRKSSSASRYVSFTCAINENSPAQDTITISLTSAQTKSMSAGRYLYDVEIFTSAGEVTRVLEGQIEILASITQSNPLSQGIEFKFTEENFVPHVMYDPINGDPYLASTYAEHTDYMNQGYIHVYPFGADGSGNEDGSLTFSTSVAAASQSPLDTVDPTIFEQASDTTNNSPSDSGGESGSYY